MEAYFKAGAFSSSSCSARVRLHHLSVTGTAPSTTTATICSAVAHPFAALVSLSKFAPLNAAIAPHRGLASFKLVLTRAASSSQPAIRRRGAENKAESQKHSHPSAQQQKEDNKEDKKDSKEEKKHSKPRRYKHSSSKHGVGINPLANKHSKQQSDITPPANNSKKHSVGVNPLANSSGLASLQQNKLGLASTKLSSSNSGGRQRSQLRKAPVSSLALSQFEMDGVKQKKEGNGADGSRMSKRHKKDPEELKWNLKLNMSSKYGDLHSALEVYDASKQGLVNLKQHHYNVLLYICSAAASGSITRRKRGANDKNSDGTGKHENNSDESGMNGNGKDSDASSHDLKKIQETEEGSDDVDIIQFSSDDIELAKNMGTEIYEHMLQAKVPTNEATFTSVIRLAVAKGDGDMAFQIVKNMAAANIGPKLRSYGPVLLCFTEKLQVEKAFEVDDHMLAAGVLPDESLLEALLKLSVTAGLEEKVYSLLHRLRASLRDLSPRTVATIEKWFHSGVAASAGKAKWDNLPLPSLEKLLEANEAVGGGWHGLGWLGRGSWKTKRTNISKTGVCLSCGEKLCTIDLDPEETEKFAKSVADLASQREQNSSQFRAFQHWLDKNGPYDAIIDGANIGLYNNALRGFNFPQVVTVANAVKDRSSTRKSPLIVLHCRRISDKAGLPPKSAQIVNDWVKENTLYATPYGSNDDWYWLYAAVHCKCLLVTNDEMRDHLFELLGNDFFPRWKERHQVRFTFSSNGLELFLPPPFTTVIQESLSGSWHIPQTGGDDVESPREWLCVTRCGGEHSPTADVEKQSELLPSETSLNLEVAEKQ